MTDFTYPGHSAHRCHAVADRSGRTLHAQLLAALSRQSEVTFAVLMRLVRCLTRRTRGSGRRGGCATGRRRRAGDGRRRDPRHQRIRSSTRPGASAHARDRRRDLLRGRWIDRRCARHRKRTRRADRLSRRLPGPWCSGRSARCMATWAAVMHGAIVVNERGRSASGMRRSATPNMPRWCWPSPADMPGSIIDERIDGECRRFTDYQRLVEMRAIRWADDAPALQRLIGPGSRIEETLAGISAAVGDGADDFGRTFASELAGALRRDPSDPRPVPAPRAVCSSVPGRGAARRGGDPGLSAAGGAAAGMSGHGAAGYLAGNGLLAAVGLGYLAGRQGSAPV